MDADVEYNRPGWVIWVCADSTEDGTETYPRDVTGMLVDYGLNMDKRGPGERAGPWGEVTTYGGGMLAGAWVAWYGMLAA